MKKLLTILVVIIMPMIVLGQQKNEYKVNYPDNVKKSLSEAERKMIVDVYGNEAAEKYIFGIPQRLKDTKHILRNRVKITKIDNKSLTGLKKLSEIPVFNVYKDIKRDQTVDIKNFNPLKYQFNFFGKDTEYIRIDNTPYIIIIKSQFQ